MAVSSTASAEVAPDAVATLADVAPVRLMAAKLIVTVSAAVEPTCTLTEPLAPAVPSNNVTPLNLVLERTEVICDCSAVTSVCRLVRSVLE